MALPLSPSHSATLNLNLATPATSRRTETDLYEVKAYATHTMTATMDSGENNTQSSPFVPAISEGGDSVAGQENVSPSKARSRHSRVLSGTELSPLKILSASSLASTVSEKQTSPASGARSARKFFSPEKRFPVKVSSSDVEATPRPAMQERTMSLEEALRANEGLKQAIQIFEDEQGALEDEMANAEEATATVTMRLEQRREEHQEEHHEDIEDEPAGSDDTMISTFSTFSAVPNMTMLARFGQSPSKPGTASRGRTDLSPMKTPRHGAAARSIPDSGNTTNLLMDFTEQFNLLTHRQTSPSRRGVHLPSSRTAGNLVSETPARSAPTNLLDFDIPPLPTPRSIPTITPRELESLKSGFLSEISSLKASLSGKEAEVQSLKTAVGDAEKRVGESLEKLREERAAKDAVTAERESWERRGREMEVVLRQVKEEIVRGQRDREDLELKVDEAEKRREAAEMMAQDAESKMAGMRAAKATEEREKSLSPDKGGSSKSGANTPGGTSNTAREVEVAVERVARELHALYKSKHETKVAALKKSYENRWERKVRELEGRIDELTDENDKLRLGRDATLTKVDPAALAAAEEERKAQAAKDSAQICELHAEVEKLEAVVKTVKADNDELRILLERERVEKGELVQLAEEMMAVQAEQSMIARDVARYPSTNHLNQQLQAPTPAGIAAARMPAGSPGKKKNSLGGGRVSTGIKMPGASTAASGAAESRLARGGQHERTRSNGPGAGLPRPGSGLAPPRSGLVGSMEKLGSYGRRGAE